MLGMPSSDFFAETTNIIHNEKKIFNGPPIINKTFWLKGCFINNIMARPQLTFVRLGRILRYVVAEKGDYQKYFHYNNSRRFSIDDVA